MPLGPMAAALKPDTLAQGGCTVGTSPAGVGAPPALLTESPSALATLARALKNVTCLKAPVDLLLQL